MSDKITITPYNENSGITNKESEKIEKRKLIEAKRQNFSQSEIDKLQSELQELENGGGKEIEPTKNNDKLLLTETIGIFFLLIFFGGTFLVIKNKLT